MISERLLSNPHEMIMAAGFASVYFGVQCIQSIEI